MAQKKLLMIINRKAGRNQSAAPLFDAACVLSAGGFLLDLHPTAAPGDAAEYIHQHGGEYDAVVAVGGDGTLNECVSGLLRLDSPPPLGYLPRGSTNDFAASLRLPTDPVEGARAILAAVPRRLDVGLWNNRHFLYVASFGAFTRSSYAAPQAAKNALGHFAYILEGMKDLDTLRPYAVRLSTERERLDGEYLFGAVCSSTSIGGLMKLDERQVTLDDGLFELLLIPNPHSPQELQGLVRALLNQEYDAGGVIFRHVQSVRVETEEDLPWSLDGEYAPSAPAVKIENRRQALSMLL